MIKVIDSFKVQQLGILVELQHYEAGIPPGTLLMHTATQRKWTVERRMLYEPLLLLDAEVLFDCETQLDHISPSFKTKAAQKEAVTMEIAKRKAGVYWYLFNISKKQIVNSPEPGLKLMIKSKKIV